jgi:hypothetical protein
LHLYKFFLEISTLEDASITLSSNIRNPLPSKGASNSRKIETLFRNMLRATVHTI